MPDQTRRHSRSLIVTLLVIVRNAYFNSSPGPASPFNGDKAILEIQIALQICRRASRRYGIHRSTNNSRSGNDIVLRKTMDSRGGLAISGVRDFRSRIPYLRCGSCRPIPPVQIASNYPSPSPTTSPVDLIENLHDQILPQTLITIRAENKTTSAIAQRIVEDDSRLGRWVVCSAWPYVNDRTHLGTVTHLLSADVHSRYLSVKGDRVVMVYGRVSHRAPKDLINPYCVLDHSTPVMKESASWFFDLPKLSDQLKKYVEENPNLPENARNFSLSWIRDGLKPRSLTRDLAWGIPAPFKGA